MPQIRFHSEDAERYGLHEAIVLAEVKELIDYGSSDNRSFRHGRNWALVSVDSIRKELEFLSGVDVKAALESLYGQDAILIEGAGEETKSAWVAPLARTKMSIFEYDLAEDDVAMIDHLYAGLINYLPHYYIQNIPRTSFVYIIYCSSTGFYKIGKSNDPKMRLLQIAKAALGKPLTDDEYKLIRMFPVHGRVAFTIEKHLHKLFGFFSQGGEWFSIDAQGVAFIEELLDNTYIDLLKKYRHRLYPRLPSSYKGRDFEAKVVQDLDMLTELALSIDPAFIPDNESRFTDSPSVLLELYL